MSKPNSPEKSGRNRPRSLPRLATRRIAPTPDAYRDIYNEIAGIAAAPPAQAAAVAVADPGAGIGAEPVCHPLAETPGELAEIGRA
jgi:diguanylate cyclase